MLRRNIEELSAVFTARYQQLQGQMLADKLGCDYNDPTVKQFVYYKITGCSALWDEDNLEGKQPYQFMEEALTGLFSVQAPVSVIYKSEDNKIAVYFGTDYHNDAAVRQLLESSFPNISFEHNGDPYRTDNLALYDYFRVVGEKSFAHGGYIKGNPSIPEQMDLNTGIKRVIDGMGKADWVVTINAIPQPKSLTFNKLNLWLNEASACSVLSNVTYNDVDVKESTSHQQKYHLCDKYYEKVEQFCEQMSDAFNGGEWLTTISYGAATPKEADIVASLFVSAFHGDNIGPEPLHFIKNTAPQGFVPLAVPPQNTLHRNFNKDINYYSLSNSLSTRELAYFAMFPNRDTFGFSVDDYVEFDVSQDREGDIEVGKIIYNGRLTDAPYTLNVNAFNRHCLVIGLTGGGKTNTIKSLFNSVANGAQRVPFMLIEPAKREYWELYKCGFDDLQVYSIGASAAGGNRYCLNPFERVGKLPIQTHIDYVFSAFKASFIMYTPMPYVLETAIYEIYEDYGWDIKNDINPNGEIYPTVEDLYHKIPKVVTDMGYDAKMRNDLIGSLQARINSLRIGNKGNILNVARSFPIGQILDGHVVVELEDIGDDDVKAFVISLLLIQLSEYRKQQTDCQTGVRHLLLIEEAHRLLKNVQSGSGESADPRGAAVEFFCNLLAELRSKGQGFVIADQIPSKLAPDLIKNTNIKILHRTVDESERLLMGGAMHMTDEQKEQIAAFAQGVAAVYAEGDFRPKLIRTKYAKIYELPERDGLTREEVVAITKKNCIPAEDYPALSDKNPACLQCDRACERQYQALLSKFPPAMFDALMTKLNAAIKGHYTAKEMRLELESFVGQTLISQNDREFRKNTNCLLLCVLDRLEAKDSTKEAILERFNFKGE
ncbi:MAG: ATP-binding protein [Eubacterium sp.]|nr:ATP-binding protein [Eubacterium sp.]